MTFILVCAASALAGWMIGEGLTREEPGLVAEGAIYSVLILLAVS